MDMTWLQKGRKRTAWLLLLALFWGGSHHVAPKWDYMCMKQEVEHSPTIHQSLGGPVWKFVHVYSAGALTVVMRVCMCKGVMKCAAVQYVCVCLRILWGLARRANGGLHTSASPSSCTPGARTATCLRGFQYPLSLSVFVCLRCCVYPRNAVHYICMCGWLLHTVSTHMHAEAEGAWRLEQYFTC